MLDVEETSDNASSRLLILSSTVDTHKCDDLTTKNLLLSIEARNVTLSENILQKEERNIIGKL